jgi:hypothetical protein
LDRCRREIAAIEAELLAGNPDVEGLCQALSDWSEELRILQREVQPYEGSPQNREVGGGDIAVAPRAS